MASVTMLFATYTFTYEAKNDLAKSSILALFLYALYDISFSFFIGTNILSWCLANIFIKRVRETYANNVKFGHFFIFSAIFFTVSNLVIYMTYGVFYWQTILYQMVLSTVSILLITYFFGKLKKAEEYYFQ